MLLDLYAALSAPAVHVHDSGGAPSPLLRKRVVEDDELAALVLALT